MRDRVRRLILTAIFVALAVAGGLALVEIPNVEIVTATCFMAGLMLGPLRGAIVGAMAELLYSSLNPLGPAIPPLLLAQIIAMSMAGAAGGWSRRAMHSKFMPAVFGGTGLALTLFFDFLTTFAFGLTIGQTLNGLFVALIAGLTFYFTHAVTNTLIFTLVLPIITARLRFMQLFPKSIQPFDHSRNPGESASTTSTASLEPHPKDAVRCHTHSSDDE